MPGLDLLVLARDEGHGSADGELSVVGDDFDEEDTGVTSLDGCGGEDVHARFGGGIRAGGEDVFAEFSGVHGVPRGGFSGGGSILNLVTASS